MSDKMMLVATIAYVVLTFFIVLSNKKTADAAMSQLSEMQSASKQQYSLALLERRLNVFQLFSEWVNTANILFMPIEESSEPDKIFINKVFRGNIPSMDNYFDYNKRVEELKQEYELTIKQIEIVFKNLTEEDMKHICSFCSSFIEASKVLYYCENKGMVFEKLKDATNTVKDIPEELWNEMT